MKFLTIGAFISTFFALSLSDCYFPFLESGGECGSDADCGGNPCVMDVSSVKRVCCKNKPGTVAPECPAGTSYSGLPVLCDPSDGADGCPAGLSCVPSVTSFTKDPASPGSICCK
ncbi:unnamed protein product [Caenorhabditis bovis]|uniref:CC domain-containing protein n=1 Tax=Caenorhabditis bovis TaxID=2654633 RepID=A0A8S1EQH3_9PELO|nr:unnamed protein product [Caenorhabditis bovis]